MPGARAKGSFAYRAITRVAKMAETAVAENSAFLSIPVSPRMEGLTARM